MKKETVLSASSGQNAGAYGRMTDTGTLRDPLWGQTVEPTPTERRLLGTRALRRLHHVRHAGPAALLTQHTSTRLQHTLGVFTLIAHFSPDWPELRAAALLHDIGHGPFSHALEGIEGFDHHNRANDELASGEIDSALDGLDRRQVFALIEGDIPSPLRNKERILHADHLDSWVRSAAAFGILPKPASELLGGFRLNGPHLEADEETAELTLKLILHEAHYHASTANIGPVAVLRAAAERLIAAGGLEAAELGRLTDLELTGLLLRHPATSEEMQRLLYRADLLNVARAEEAAPDTAYRHSLRKLYLALPLIAGGQPPETLPSYPLLADLPSLLGEYRVFWPQPISG
ncbi:HD domain-containing protein [Saccharibacillus sp. CPCC 101409]|uniref:HD domain-containing protein n=1 Tax=Saccharibacillus sp. CPCC 101409 TaxID=3058041 RepID=UPI002670D120|nr:HD domain-containing protein [Saccharibacillus sp. CPCC 101409]MDO3410817.1 HD domain-containing protein [Saccharibacillus sp. CPCC 101409]